MKSQLQHVLLGTLQYMLTIRWAVDDMALAYSQQLAILLTMLLNEVLSALNGLVTQVFNAQVLSLLVPHHILCLRGRLSSYTWWSTGRGQGWSQWGVTCTVTYYYVTLNISINRKGGSSNIDQCHMQSMGAHDISPSGPIPSWLLTFLAQQKPLPPPSALPAQRHLSLPLHIDGKSGRRDLSLLPLLKRRADRGHRPLNARHFRLHSGE